MSLIQHNNTTQSCCGCFGAVALACVYLTAFIFQTLWRGIRHFYMNTYQYTLVVRVVLQLAMLCF